MPRWHRAADSRDIREVFEWTAIQHQKARLIARRQASDPSVREDRARRRFGPAAKEGRSIEHAERRQVLRFRHRGVVVLIAPYRDWDTVLQEYGEIRTIQTVGPGSQGAVALLCGVLGHPASVVTTTMPLRAAVSASASETWYRAGLGSAESGSPRNPATRFLVRLDGGFATPEILDFLDAEPGLDYVVAVGKNAVLQRHAESIRRFGESDSSVLSVSVSAALVNKAAALGILNRPRDVLEACDEVVRRFGKSEIQDLEQLVATALANKGGALGVLNRPQDALEACDEAIRRFGKSGTPGLQQSVATALLNRGGALSALHRPQDALEACDEVIRRFGESETPDILERVAQAHVSRGIVLNALNRPQDAVRAYDEMVRRFGTSEVPALVESAATALVNKAAVLNALNRPQDALKVSDEVVRRFGESEIAAVPEWIAKALVNKAAALNALNRPQDTLGVYDEVVRRFGKERDLRSSRVGGDRPREQGH